MRTQPNLELRCFISTIAAMSARDGPFGPGLRRADEKQKPVFAVHQGLVKFEQRGRPEDHRKARDTARDHELGSEAEDKAVERGEIGSPMPGAIADQQLMLEQRSRPQIPVLPRLI